LVNEVKDPSGPPSREANQRSRQITREGGAAQLILNNVDAAQIP
jgi:hypothetical protein